MVRLALTIITCFGLPSVGEAETDFTALTEKDRQIFHATIREVLLTNPNLVARALAPSDIYAEEIAKDLTALERAADTLFPNGEDIALFTGANCPDCEDANAELTVLARKLGVQVARFDIDTNTALAQSIGIDRPPFYVLRDKMVRGPVPAIVLERYLAAKP